MTRTADFSVTHRDGSMEIVKVSYVEHAKKVNVKIGDFWWTMTASKRKVFVANRTEGHFWGIVVQTTAGTEIRFSHNGRAYAAENPITAFARMVKGEGL